MVICKFPSLAGSARWEEHLCLQNSAYKKRRDHLLQCIFPVLPQFWVHLFLWPSLTLQLPSSCVVDTSNESRVHAGGIRASHRKWHPRLYFGRGGSLPNTVSRSSLEEEGIHLPNHSKQRSQRDTRPRKHLDPSPPHLPVTRFIRESAESQALELFEL